VDFFDEPQHLHVHVIAERTRRWGRQGRVAVGHCTELAALPPAELEPILSMLVESGIGVIVLPATDLYLMGRRDERNVRRGLAPVRRLLAAASLSPLRPTTCGTPSPPVGNANLPLMGFLLAVGAHMGTTQDLGQALAMLTQHPARILRVPDYGLAVGCRADLVLWETERPEEIVAALAPPRLVVKAGRITVEHERGHQGALAG